MALQQLSSSSTGMNSEESSSHSDVHVLPQAELKLLDLAAKMSNAKTHQERSDILHSMNITRINLQHLLDLIKTKQIQVTPNLEEILKSQEVRLEKQEEIELRTSS